MKKFLKIMAVLLLCYAVFGFIIFPLVLKYFGEKALRDNVSPDAVIATVKANPFTWEVQVEGLNLSDPAGQWTLEVERATVNLSARTLYKFFPVLDEISLESPRISYLRSPQEEEVEEESIEPDEETPQSLEDFASLLNSMEIPEVYVVLLEIKDGAMHFSDVTNETPFEKRVEPINFRLENFTTEVDSGADNSMHFLAKTDRGAEFEWKGELTSQPFASSGTIQVSGFGLGQFFPYFEKLIRFDLERATYDMQFSYAINFGDLENVFKVSDGSVDLTNVRCVGREDSSEFFVLNSAGVADFSFDYNSMQVDVDRVFVDSGVLGVRRDEGGAINLLNLLVLADAAPISEPEAVEEVEEVAEVAEVEVSDGSFEIPALPVAFSLDEFSIQDFRIQWVDSLVPGGADIGLVISQYSLKGVSSDFSKPVALDLRLQVGETGRVSVGGELTPAVAGMDLVLGVEALDLSLANAYGTSMAETQVGSGTFVYTGEFSGDVESGYHLSGDGSVQDFSVALSGENAVELEWQSFSFTDLSARSEPLSVSMGDVTLTAPKAVLTRSAPPNPEKVPAAEVAVASDETLAEPATVDSAAAGPVDAPLDVHIASFSVDQGSLVMIDQGIQPNFRLDVADAKVDVKNITLGQEEVTEFSISALVNRSEFKMAGSAYLIDPRSQTSMTMSLTDFSLPVLSPYTGKSVGRKIGSGWFTINTDLQVNDGTMKASNAIRIEQMKLGDSVDSPDAMNLPLSLAISLLKGSDGVMKLKLPLSGDLYDPSIGMGQIIRTAVVGLIRSVALSPFSMLSGLVGSDADLSKVEFAPGSSELSPKMTKQLKALGSALQKRPQLILGITPSLSNKDLLALTDDPQSAGSKTKGADGEKSKSEKGRRLFENRKYKPVVKADATSTSAKSDQNGDLLPGVARTDPIATELMAARVEVVREYLLEMEGVSEERLSVRDPDLSVNRSIVAFSLE